MRVLTVFAALCTALSGANAEVVATQRIEKETVSLADDGREIRRRVNAEKVVPGEQVIYTLDFENNGNDPATDLVLVMPVPSEVSYVEGSVGGEEASVTFSVDGGATYLARGRLAVQEDGEERPARGEDITHIRWIVPNLSPRQASDVSYRAILR